MAHNYENVKSRITQERSSQNHERDVDRKDALLQMMDRHMEEAEDQYITDMKRADMQGFLEQMGPVARASSAASPVGVSSSSSIPLVADALLPSAMASMRNLTHEFSSSVRSAVEEVGNLKWKCEGKKGCGVLRVVGK